jgi:hypothetical protein
MYPLETFVYVKHEVAPIWVLLTLSNNRSASAAISAGERPRRSDDLRIACVFPRVLR